MNSESKAISFRQAVLRAGVVRMMGLAATFLVGLQLARYLGPEGYGHYGFALAIVAILSAVAQMGLPQLLTRELAVYLPTKDMPRAKGALVSFVWAIALVSIFLCMAVWVFLYSFGLEPHLQRTLSVALLLVPLIGATNLAVGGLRGLRKEPAAQFFDALLRPMTLGGLLFLAYLFLPDIQVTDAIMLQVFVGALSLCLGVGWLLYSLPSSLLGTRRNTHVSEWSRSARPMMGTEVLRIVEGQYLVILLGLLAAASDTGIFRVTLAMASLIGVASSLINVVTMPQAAIHHSAGDREKLQRLATTASALTFGTALLATAAIFLVGRPVIIYAFGNDFEPVWHVLLVVSASYCINGFFGAATIIMNMCGEERTVMRSYFVGLTIGTITFLLLLPRIGMIAAACALVVSELARGSLLWFSARRSLGVNLSVMSAFSREPASRA